MKTAILVLMLAAIGYAQPIGQASSIVLGPSLPSSCNVGQVWFQGNSTSGTFYTCTAPNTWTTGGGGGGGVSSVTIAGTTRQITVSGTCTITTTGTCTLSLPSNLLFPGTPTFTASTTGGASFNLPSGVAPTTPNNGDFWNLSGVLQFYDGSGTRSLIANNTSAGGDLSGTYPNPTVVKINGTALSGLATGILKNTTSTGVPSIAASSDVIALFTSCSGTQYLGADGACHSAGGGTPGGSNGQMQYNNSGAFGGQSFQIGGSLLTTTTFQRGVECATATIPYTSVQTGALTNSLAINASMPQKFRFEHMYLVESTQFVGTSITGLTVSSGTSGTYNDVTPNFALLVSGGQNAWYDRPAPPAYGTSTWNFVLYFTSVGANLSALTAGNLYVEVCGYAIQ